MKRSDGIEVFSFGIEKVWKIAFENVYEPCVTKNTKLSKCQLANRSK